MLCLRGSGLLCGGSCGRRSRGRSGSGSSSSSDAGGTGTGGRRSPGGSRSGRTPFDRAHPRRRGAAYGVDRAGTCGGPASFIEEGSLLQESLQAECLASMLPRAVCRAQPVVGAGDVRA